MYKDLGRSHPSASETDASVLEREINLEHLGWASGSPRMAIEGPDYSEYGSGVYQIKNRLGNSRAV